MLRLYQAANLPDAYLVLHRLEQAGIAARVFNEHAQGGMGEIPFTHVYPEIWLLDPRDEPRARGVVAEYENASYIGQPTTCSNCGEENPAGFEVCWQCGSLFE
jgi:hypothetical protein